MPYPRLNVSKGRFFGKGRLMTVGYKLAQRKGHEGTNRDISADSRQTSPKPPIYRPGAPDYGDNFHRNRVSVASILRSL
jgi:hypothetical protein